MEDYDLLMRIILRDRSDEEIVNFIQKHPEVVRSNTAILNRAVYANPSPSIIRALVDACPDALSCQDENGLTPLSYVGDLLKPATNAILLDTVEKLYSNTSNADDDGPSSSTRLRNPLLLQDRNGDTPLHRTCDSRNSYPRVVLRMLQICPGASLMLNHEKKSPRNLAEENWRMCVDGSVEYEDDEDRNEFLKGQLLEDLEKAFDEAKQHVGTTLEGV